MVRTYLLILIALLLSQRAVVGQEMEEPTAHIIGVSVQGNKITKERIILREIVFEEGDSMVSSMFYEKLERSRQNLMNTGLFNTVALLPVYIDKSAVMVEVTVNERWYLWPSIIFDLADPNFNTWWLTKDFSRVNFGMYLTRYNLRGRNETGYIMAQFGYTRRFGFRYKVPNVDANQRWGFNVGGSFEEQVEITAGTVDNERILIRNEQGSNRDQWKAEMEVTLRRSHDVRHSLHLQYDQAEIQDTISTVSIDYFDRTSLSTRFLSLRYSFIWDRRDSRVYTRIGHFEEFRMERYGLGILDRSAPDITTLSATSKRWFRPHDKWTLGLSVRGKYTFGTPPYYVQEGLGYGNYVRGYEYYVIDGEHFILGKANVVFQLIRPRTKRVEAVPMEAFRTLYFAVYLNAYSDLGHVWDSRYASANFLANSWVNGNGVGVNVVTSYDQVIRGEYSVNALGESGFFLHFTQPL